MEERDGIVHHHEDGASKHLASAVQALNLDSDIGPVVQSQELFNLLKFAKEHDFAHMLDQRAKTDVALADAYDKLSPADKAAAVKEILGLVPPAITHPDHPELDKPFDDAKDGLGKKFASMGPGLTDVLARNKLTDDEFNLMNTRVISIRRYGGEHGPVSPQARALFDKINYEYFGGITGESLTPAAIELANLSGRGTAEAMLKPENISLPTSNFFRRDGYERNPVTSRRSSDELLTQINRIMHGPNSAPTKPGNAGFIKAFGQIP